MQRKVRKPHLLTYVSPAALILAVIAAVLAVSAGFGSRLDWWHFSTGFSLLRWGVYIAIGAVVLSLLGVFMSRAGGNKGRLISAVSGIVISASVIVLPLKWLDTARSVPPIHDITTDIQNPPRFIAVLELRKDSLNSTVYGGPEIAEQQKSAYPDITPIIISSSQEKAFNTALQSARQIWGHNT